jgi:hypothetical protein
MDGLALLCTLHADGPATLKRLRSAGCSDLEALLARPTEELSRLLDVTLAHARRLRREADLLQNRVSGGLLQEEEGAPAPTTVSEEVEMQSSSELSTVDRAILGRVLETWRARDAEEGVVEEPPAEASEESAPLAVSRIEPDFGRLSAELVERLRALGIENLSVFSRAEPIGLTRELGLAYSELRRLQYLAARVPDGGAEEPAPKPSRPVGPPDPLAPDLPFGAGIDAQGTGALARKQVERADRTGRPILERDFEIPRRLPEPALDPEASGGPFA